MPERSRPPMRSTSPTMRRLRVTIVVAMTTFGLLGAVAPSAQASTTATAVPCGLSYTTGDVPGGPLKIVYYKIRNCHPYTVKRKLDLAGTTDGQCHTIPAGGTASGTRVIAGWAGVRGIKPC